jgi:hypothetical protein
MRQTRGKGDQGLSSGVQGGSTRWWLTRRAWSRRARCRGEVMQSSAAQECRGHRMGHRLDVVAPAAALAPSCGHRHQALPPLPLLLLLLAFHYSLFSLRLAATGRGETPGWLVYGRVADWGSIGGAERWLASHGGTDVEYFRTGSGCEAGTHGGHRTAQCMRG